MIIQIEPVSGFGKVATQIEIGVFQIDVAAASAKARWMLRDSDGNELVTGTALIDGEPYAQWGEDDEYAIGLVLTDAGVMRANEAP